MKKTITKTSFNEEQKTSRPYQISYVKIKVCIKRKWKAGFKMYKTPMKYKFLNLKVYNSTNFTTLTSFWNTCSV